MTAGRERVGVVAILAAFKILSPLDLELHVVKRGATLDEKNVWNREWKAMRTPALIVAMNGVVVGTPCRDDSGAMSFQYIPEWLSEAGSRAISLSLPLQRGRIRGKIDPVRAENTQPAPRQLYPPA